MRNMRVPGLVWALMMSLILDLSFAQERKAGSLQRESERSLKPLKAGSGSRWILRRDHASGLADWKKSFSKRAHEVDCPEPEEYSGPNPFPQGTQEWYGWWEDCPPSGAVGPGAVTCDPFQVTFDGKVWCCAQLMTQVADQVGVPIEGLDEAGYDVDCSFNYVDYAYVSGACEVEEAVCGHVSDMDPTWVSIGPYSMKCVSGCEPEAPTGDVGQGETGGTVDGPRWQEPVVDTSPTSDSGESVRTGDTFGQQAESGSGDTADDRSDWTDAEWGQYEATTEVLKNYSDKELDEVLDSWGCGTAEEPTDSITCAAAEDEEEARTEAEDTDPGGDQPQVIADPNCVPPYCL